MRYRVIFTLLLLTGCIKPIYERQYVDMPQTWRLPTDEGSTLCNIGWWKLFNDPVLDELIVIALKNNQDLRQAVSRVLEYYARLRIVSSELYPTVNGNGSYNRLKNSIALPGFEATDAGLLTDPAGDTSVADPNLHRINNDYQLFFSLSWELDFWGRLRSASAASYAELLSQIQARRALVISVVTAVANGYIVLRQFDSQLAVSQKTLASRRESLKLAIDRFEVGETSLIEVRQAESEVEIAAIRVIEFHRQIPQQENLLSILLGENPRRIARGDAVEVLHKPVEIPAGLPSELLTRRPDIVQAEQQLIAANARVTEAQALFFPQFTLTGLYGNESNHLKNFMTSPAQMWQYGLNAVMPLFNAGRTMYEVRAAKARRDQALFAYRQTILNAFREVDDALISSQKNQELVQEHLRQVKVLKDYLHLAQLRYAEGEIDYLNVLDAERSLFNAQLELVASQAENLTAVVQLFGALGGGWVTDADNLMTKD